MERKRMVDWKLYIDSRQKKILHLCGGSLDRDGGRGGGYGYGSDVLSAWLVGDGDGDGRGYLYGNGIGDGRGAGCGYTCGGGVGGSTTGRSKTQW